MSKLNFSNIEEAFVLGSEQIKNTQAEIANLKKICSFAQKNFFQGV